MKRTVAQWHSIRPGLKTTFAAMGVTTCEMCGRGDYLSFAHRLKRRFITTVEELETVALLCMSNPDGEGCHNKVERMSHQEMYDTITKLIENRCESQISA